MALRFTARRPSAERKESSFSSLPTPPASHAPTPTREKRACWGPRTLTCGGRLTSWRGLRPCAFQGTSSYQVKNHFTTEARRRGEKPGTIAKADFYERALEKWNNRRY